MRTIEQINQISESLKAYGMRVGFHSEAGFFEDVDGARPWDVLADSTSPDVVLQLDTGNVQNARPEGVDVVAVFRRNPGRIRTMHVKPFSRTKPDAFIGEDDLPWADIVAESQRQRIEWYIIEYERPEHPPLEALRANLAGFRKVFPA
jgi:sugar phosphate isomerase/epimerase